MPVSTKEVYHLPWFVFVDDGVLFQFKDCSRTVVSNNHVSVIGGFVYMPTKELAFVAYVEPCLELVVLRWQIVQPQHPRQYISSKDVEARHQSENVVLAVDSVDSILTVLFFVDVLIDRKYLTFDSLEVNVLGYVAKGSVNSILFYDSDLHNLTYV